METVTVYHYSDSKFKQFDFSKCDGAWFTDIAPEQKEMLNEIGAAGSKFVAKCEVSYSNEMINGSDSDVEDQLNAEGADAIINIYEGFKDYAVANNSQVKILGWTEL